MCLIQKQRNTEKLSDFESIGTILTIDRLDRIVRTNGRTNIVFFKIVVLVKCQLKGTGNVVDFCLLCSCCYRSLNTERLKNEHTCKALNLKLFSKKILKILLSAVLK